MPAVNQAANPASLDDCHIQIHQKLLDLAALSRHLDTVGIDAAAQHMAHGLETFFSNTSRQHHAQEEKTLFPSWLCGANEALAAAVRTLQQDHGWIEENLLELSPQLSAIASGNNWFDMPEFQHGVEVFIALYRQHMELEDVLIDPQSRAKWLADTSQAPQRVAA